MHPVECLQGQAGADGFVVAWDADTGRERWRFNSAPIESSPLLRQRRLYFGSWDHNVYALDADTGSKIWSFQGDDEVNTSAAYWQGRIYIASDGGTLYALSAQTGKLLWSAQSESSFGSREFFYATPTVAYGRVYIGNTDGTMYVFGAKSGKLLWARPLGPYIYGAAAVYEPQGLRGHLRRQVLRARRGHGRHASGRSTPSGAVHAAPTVMAGLVYYAICSSCGSEAQRAVARGPDATYAVRARDGKQVWRFPGGQVREPRGGGRGPRLHHGARAPVRVRARRGGAERRERMRARGARRARALDPPEKLPDPLRHLRSTSSDASGSP